MMNILENNVLDYRPTWVDVVVSLGLTLIIPFILGWLYEIIGAFIPLLIYYGVCSIIIVLWRKGSLEYSIPNDIAQIKKLFTPLFIGFFLFEIVRSIVTSFTIIPVPVSDFNLFGFLITLIIWSCINGSMEQLVWIYVFDSCFFFKQENLSKTKRSIIAFACYFIFIMNIHLFFWVKFLWESEFILPWSPLLILSQFILATGYLLLYKKENNMFPVALAHVFVDVTAVIFARYSILPYLFKL